MSVLCGDESSGPSREFYEEFSYSGAKQVIPRMHTCNLHTSRTVDRRVSL